MCVLPGLDQLFTHLNQLSIQRALYRFLAEKLIKVNALKKLKHLLEAYLTFAQGLRFSNCIQDYKYYP